ncbi:Ku protein [Lysobacter koreensis]|uniref:Non-homologous end joining protein Ku n=1 Tax=Lysobacter koreensis TaxID=266122 RepID=A0ABW2YKF7_9GAMM
MARPIWTGSLSFGLLNIPIQLMPGERRTDISFRMLDSRTKDPVRYERVNAETGEEVPWKEIVKAYQYDKDSYVVLEAADIAAAASENTETIALDAFVEQAAISPAYLEKPYLLVPGKRAEKGYVLLREVLKKSKRVGIGRVVIRTREYLSMVIPQGDALMLILMRFPQELVDPAEYKIPEGGAAKWKITPKEMQMAQTLLESMAEDWKPGDYKDEFRERLTAVINKRIKAKGATTRIEEPADDEPAEASTNVVDFMALLQRSLKQKGETGQAATKPAASKPATKAAKAAKKAPAKKASKRKAG